MLREGEWLPHVSMGNYISLMLLYLVGGGWQPGLCLLTLTLLFGGGYVSAFSIPTGFSRC